MRLFVTRAGETPSTTAVYRFRGPRGMVSWPREHGTYLGMAGAWNALWRAGHAPSVGPIAELPPAATGDVLFVQADGPIDAEAAASLRRWAASGARLVCTGNGEYWRDVFPGASQWTSEQFENPYAALGVESGGRVEVLAPVRWRYTRTAADAAGPQLVALHGERQTPSRALVSSLGVPFILTRGAWTFVNGDPFAALQSWLQGQDDLSPWLAWRDRLCWLDDWIASVLSALAPSIETPALLRGEGVPGLGATTVVLRHDLDDSRDTAYLDEEERRGIEATHGVLRDNNTAFWRERLARSKGHESALHYTTGTRVSIAGARRLLLESRPPSYRPLAGGAGIHRQVRWAQRNGIGVSTLLRHLSFLRYPEWVAAIDHVTAEEPAVRGSSSLFRGQVLRWGTDHVDGTSGTIGEWPDPMFPFWMPFKLAHAGENGRLLRGWESTSMMELEPDLAAQLLDRPSRFPQRVFTFGFHPAHASRGTFNRGGSLTAFRGLLENITRRHIDVRTLDDVYRLAGAAEGARR